IVKRNLAAEELMKTDDYKKLVPGIQLPAVLIGHSRMVTNGTEDIHENNQPLVKNGMVTIHNGIIVNRNQIWGEFPGIKCETDTDTEVIPALLHHYLSTEKSLTGAVRQLYQKIEGVASIAVLFENTEDLLIATNNGSLYTAFNHRDRVLFFTSEKYMLKSIFKTFPRFAAYEIIHMEPGDACLVNTSR
ncbi:MAG: hypothetical protein GY950_30015, partial [bacterium]|nr:hypothetical protein [bacterium]